MIFIIDADLEFAKTIQLTLKNQKTQIFASGIDAMNEIIRNGPPDLIILDILVDGPDSFAFLNELISYEDTMRLPIIIVSALDFHGADLSVYSVVKIFNKTSLLPQELRNSVEQNLVRQNCNTNNDDQNRRH